MVGQYEVNKVDIFVNDILLLRVVRLYLNRNIILQYRTSYRDVSSSGTSFIIMKLTYKCWDSAIVGGGWRVYYEKPSLIGADIPQ